MRAGFSIGRCVVGQVVTEVRNAVKARLSTQDLGPRGYRYPAGYAAWCRAGARVEFRVEHRVRRRFARAMRRRFP